MDANSRKVTVPVGPVNLAADLVIPASSHGVVAFAHGSGSGRFSPRNQYVASQLNGVGLATVLADLLTPDEERADAATGHLRFDIDLLTTRVTALVDWLTSDAVGTGRRIGLFGASTGAAAALAAAAKRPGDVAATVSRGGRPDLAGDALRRVHQPTLLIVGGSDHTVLDLNRQAMQTLAGPTRLEVVPHASHLFEEPGALEQVASLASDWFAAHLTHDA